MNEEQKVKKQLLKNTILNLITFTIIFYILGMIVYSQFRNSLYMSSDLELNNFVSQEENGFVQKDNGMANDTARLDNIRPEKEETTKRENNQRDEENPRLIIILRDSEGNIEENIKNERLNDIFTNIEFDSNNINSIYEINIQGYVYRGINYKTKTGEYKQALINVDSEKSISEKFIKNLTISFTISLIAILIASSILSRISLKPIIEAWKKQTKFVQDASHELRTPLTIIKAKQESLLEKPDEKIIDNAEDISITLQETQRLTKLIKELMELAKSDSNQLKLNKEKFNLDEEVKGLIELYKDVAKSEKKELNFDLKFNEEIYADSNKIKELLVILLDNSIKYTENGDKINVRTYKKENKCVIEVEDTGIGISKEAMDHIFERFYREEQSRNREKGGMGLGLAIGYSIVEAHKGSIKFEKNREKGTKVIVRLPISH